MGILIHATTDAATSPEFRVVEASLGILFVGLAGAEQGFVEVKISDGTFVSVRAVSSAEPDTTIIVNGTYRVRKAATAGAVSAQSV